MISDEQLEQVTGGAYITIDKQQRFAVGPVLIPNDRFLFGADFDYPKRDISGFRG